MAALALTGWSTDFSGATPEDFEAPVVRMLDTSAGGPRHVFVPSVTRLRDGTLLATCRWDATGSEEGDDTNEQALLWSDDDGVSWSGGDRPIVTIADGTGFARASAITHSLVFEDAAGEVWLYYSINQPHTWGPDPRRSTGGGEIRRIRLSRDAGWSTIGDSSVVWGIRHPVPDGQGGTLHDIRIALEDKVVRTKTGTLLMAVGGRCTVDDPRGSFLPLNRCWVLESSDDGATWSTAHFVGGSDSLALAEPTIEVTNDGVLVCLMRVQYGTGRELYQSVSTDNGRSWSPPVATGLPNAGEFGTKPFLQRIGHDRFALLVFSEPGDAGRTGASVYLTDGDGLITARWPRKKALLIESPGQGDRPAYGVGGYGWLAPLGDGGLIAVLATHHDGLGRISAVRANADWLEGPVIEPLAIRDDAGDDRPALRLREGRQVLRFPSARSRARDCAFASLTTPSKHIRMRIVVDSGPSRSRFDILRLDSMHGRHPWVAVALDRTRSRELWLIDAAGWRETGFEPVAGEAFVLDVEITGAHTARVLIDGALRGELIGSSSEGPDLLTIGGLGEYADRCSIDLLEVEYWEAPA